MIVGFLYNPMCLSAMRILTGLVRKNGLDLQRLLTQKSSSSNVQCVLWLKSSVPGRVGGRRKAHRRGTVSICLHVSFSLAFKRCLWNVIPVECAKIKIVVLESGVGVGWGINYHCFIFSI